VPLVLQEPPEPLERQVPQVQLAWQAQQDRRAFKAWPEPRDQPGLLVPRVPREASGHRGQQERPGPLVPRVVQVLLEQLGRKGQQAPLGPQARQARRVWRVQQELRGQQGRKATLGRRGRLAWLVPPGQKEIKAIQAPLARKESKDQQALLAPPVRPVPLVRRGTRATQARLDRKANKDRKALLERRGPLGPQVPREVWGHKGRRVLLVLREPQVRKPRWSMRLSPTSLRPAHRPHCTWPRTRRGSTSGSRPSTWRSASRVVVAVRR
jgi:hypothetical protein